MHRPMLAAPRVTGIGGGGRACQGSGMCINASEGKIKEKKRSLVLKPGQAAKAHGTESGPSGMGIYLPVPDKVVPCPLSLGETHPRLPPRWAAGWERTWLPDLTQHPGCVRDLSPGRVLSFPGWSHAGELRNLFKLHFS